jgi:hypothetical protein
MISGMGSLPAKLRMALAMAGLIGLAGCPTVDLGDTPADIGTCKPDRSYFETTIWPMYIDNADAAKSCVSMGGCHDDSNNPRSAMHFKTTTPIDYAANYRAITLRLNCSDPEASEAVSYPVQFLPHPVMLFDINSPEVQNVFLPWFDQ